MKWFLVATVFTIGAITARSLIALNLKLYRAIGLTRFADFWDSQMSRLLPTVRSACVAGILVAIAGGIGLY